MLVLSGSENRGGNVSPSSWHGFGRRRRASQSQHRKSLHPGVCGPAAMKRRSKSVFAGLFLLLVGACDGSGTPTTSVPPTSAPSGKVLVSPEFIQGAIPGAEVVLLVSQSDETAGIATVTAAAPGATITVKPSEISGVEVAEVTVVPEATTSETELVITIEVTTVDTTYTVTKTTTVLPWGDDRGGQAAEILGLFTSWLGENRPELGVTPETRFEGTYLAPQLLVVSHYGFFSDQWEIGLAWHVMIPPDDFSEIYLRPRSELRPNLGFRIDSWQTALDTGDYQVAEAEPPFEVVR